MSTRAMRRQAEASAKAASKTAEMPAEEDEEEEEEDLSTRESRQKIRNLFALLDDGANEENEPVGESAADDVEANKVEEARKTAKATTKKKKPKSKKKKAQQQGTSNDDDDAILAEASLQVDQSKRAETELERKRATILRIEAKYLQADFEIRKRFGNSVSEQVQQDRVPRGALKINTKLTRPKMNWPAFSKLGMDMAVKETKKVNGQDVHIFEYRHSKEYEMIQQQFWSAVHSHDPSALTNLHHNAPYHIDTLLQLSEMLRMHDNHPEAADVIERALFALEAAAHPLFTLTNASSCKLDYAKRENRALFVALFLHAVSLSRRSCYRTALEVTKLLLQLDASNATAGAESGDPDPLGASLAVDFYALKANEADWFIEWYSAENETRCLSLLPNFAYSIALAFRAKALRVAKQRGGSADEASNWQLHADCALRYALLQFPGTLNSLLERLSVQPDAYVEKHAHFAPLKDRYRDPAELKQLEALYASRCAPLWKGELSWLEESVRRLCTDLDAFAAGQSVSFATPKGVSAVADCSITAANLQRFDLARRTSFQRTPRNVLRHLILSECRPALEHASNYLTGLTITSYDPLPPSNSYEDYSYHAPDRVSQQRNLLQLFFESLMPGYNPEAEPSPENADQAAGGAGIENAVRGTVNALRDALRTVMDNIHQNPAVQNAAANEIADPNVEQNANANLGYDVEDDDDDPEWEM